MANYNSAYTGAQIDAAIGAVANKSDIGHTHTVDDIDDFPTIPTDLADLSDDANHRTVTDTEKSTWNGKADGSHSHSDYMPKSGGTFTGQVVAQNNTSYTTAQVRNIILSTSDPSGGNNGDIWIKYST